jgi:hypothetical protein
VPIVGRLPHRLGIILPSLRQGGHALSPALRREVRQRVEEWFAQAFTGSTEDRLQVRPRLRGRWGAGSGVSVEEVEEVWVYCSATEFRKHKAGLVQLAEWVWKRADQQAVAILVDGGMALVEGRES